MSQPRWDPEERRWLLDGDDTSNARRRRHSPEFDERSGVGVDLRERNGPASLPAAEITRTEFDEDRGPAPRPRPRAERDGDAPRPSAGRRAPEPRRPSPHRNGRRRAGDGQPPDPYAEPPRATHADPRPDLGSGGRRAEYRSDDRGTGGHPAGPPNGVGADRNVTARDGAYELEPTGDRARGAERHRNGAARYDGLDPTGFRPRNGTRPDDRAGGGYDLPDGGYGPPDESGRYDAHGRDAVGYGTRGHGGRHDSADDHDLAGFGVRRHDGGEDPYAVGHDAPGRRGVARHGAAVHEADEDVVPHDRGYAEEPDPGYGAYGYNDGYSDGNDPDGYDPDGYDPDGRDGEPDRPAPSAGGRAARRRAARARHDDAGHETRDLGPAARQDDGYCTGEQVAVGDRPDDDDDPPARRRRRWPWVVGGIALLGGLAVPVVLAMQDGSPGDRVSSVTAGAAGYGADQGANQGAAQQPADDAPAAGEVVFQVTGSGAADSITLGRGTSISQSSGAQLPWEQKYPGAPQGSEYTLTATGAEDAEGIGCKIIVDGAVISDEKSEGDFAAVSCTGRR